jgi:hypothetical protein
MAKEVEKEEEQPFTFIIPNNFTDSGKILDGMISLRNAIEAVVITGLLGKLESTILFGLMDMKIALIIMLVTLSPVLLFTVIGINGDCFTVFMKSFIEFLRNKRKLRFRRIYTHGEEEKLQFRASKGRSSAKKTTSKSKTRKK